MAADKNFFGIFEFFWDFFLNTTGGCRVYMRAAGCRPYGLYIY